MLRLIACRTASELARNIDDLQYLEDVEAREKLCEQMDLPALSVSRSNARLDCLLNVYHRFTGVMSTGVMAIDKELEIQYANSAAGEIFACQTCDLIGRDASSLFPQTTLAGFSAVDPSGMSELTETELTARRDNGSTVPLRVARAGLFDEDGKINGTIALLAEITH